MCEMDLAHGLPQGLESDNAYLDARVTWAQSGFKCTIAGIIAYILTYSTTAAGLFTTTLDGAGTGTEAWQVEAC